MVIIDTFNTASGAFYEMEFSHKPHSLPILAGWWKEAMAINTLISSIRTQYTDMTASVYGAFKLNTTIT